MIKNEAVTKATLETKEWEGELDDAELTTVSGGVLEGVTETVKGLPVVGSVVTTVTGVVPLPL